MTASESDRGDWDLVAPHVRELLDHLPDHIWFMSADLSEVLYSTRSFEAIYGMPLEDLYTDPASPIALGHPDDTGEIVRALETRRPGPDPREFVVRIRTRSGSRRVVRLRSTPIFDDHGEIAMIAGVTEDITDQITDRDHIERLNSLLTTVLDHTTDAIVLVDPDDRVRYINRRLRELAGVGDADVSGRPVDEVLPDRPELLRELTRAVLRDGRSRTTAWHHPRLDRWLETTLSAAGDDVLVVTEDRTEQHQAAVRERQWTEVNSRVERLDALGRMAGSIAHDVGNLVRLALNGLSDATEAGDPERRRAGLDDATHAMERALAITHQLLVFSRDADHEARPTTVDSVITALAPLIERTLGSHIDVRVRLGAAGAQVMSNAHRLEQMLLNLATNAARAMPGGGTFTISTDRIERGATEPAVPPGPHLKLVAEDTGRGMSAEIAERAFEPFFTTDEVHGTGLGLATVYGTAVAAGGTATIESAPDEGTRIVVCLPITDVDGERSARVLLVDSFDPNSDEILQTLEAAGYATNRLTPARAVAEAERERYDLVVLDPLAHGTSGTELVEQIAARCAGLPIVLVSGRTSHPEWSDDDAVRFVSSPYDRQALVDAVKAVVERR